MHSWGVGGLNVFIDPPKCVRGGAEGKFKIELQCTVSLSNSATSVPVAT
jgi:hypothetical protein